MRWSKSGGEHAFCIRCSKLDRVASEETMATKQGGAPIILYRVVDGKGIGVATALLEHSADPNQATTDGYGDTPLFKAAQKGHVDVVTVLLGHNADPNTAVTGNGHTIHTPHCPWPRIKNWQPVKGNDDHAELRQNPGRKRSTKYSPTHTAVKTNQTFNLRRHLTRPRLLDIHLCYHSTALTLTTSGQKPYYKAGYLHNKRIE